MKRLFVTTLITISNWILEKCGYIPLFESMPFVFDGRFYSVTGVTVTDGKIEIHAKETKVKFE